MGYKSSLKKLVQFFEKSRNNWKKKALAAKQALKLTKNRIRFLEDSKAKLKAEIKELKIQILVFQNKQAAEKISLKQEAKKKQDKPSDYWLTNNGSPSPLFTMAYSLLADAYFNGSKPNALCKQNNGINEQIFKPKHSSSYLVYGETMANALRILQI